MINIPRGELFSEQLLAGETVIVQQGQVTDDGLNTLRVHLPYADLRFLDRDRRLEQINDLFTVGLLSSYITWKLSESGESDRDAYVAGVPPFARGSYAFGHIDQDLIMIAQILSHRSSPADCRAARVAPIARVRRVQNTRPTYAEHPSFDDATARDSILALSTDTGDAQVLLGLQPPEWLAPLPVGGSDAARLSREQEALLFCEMSYLRCRVHQLEEHLDPDWPTPHQLNEIERLQSKALAIRNRIVEMNLRLVVSLAKTRVRPGYDLSDCVSDGNVALIWAVDTFDFTKGNRFST